MNTNLDMDWTGNQGLSDSDLMNISNGCGYDITIGANNGEEIRRANQTKPWPNDQEINSISTEGVNEVTHDYVDLGLKGGILWATENIKDANGNDLYFAWGETRGYTAAQVGTKKHFSWEDYEFGVYDDNNPPTFGLTKYNKEDNLSILESTDDAATQLWGPEWRMPDPGDFDKLFKCNPVWQKVNGVYGVLLTGENENTLFLPALGYASELINDSEDYGIYWCNHLKHANTSNTIVFGDELLNTDEENDRCIGLPIRPVRVNSNN